jgi:hypothetical protein
MTRQCTCGGIVTQHQLTGDREAWRCTSCQRYSAVERLRNAVRDPFVLDPPPPAVLTEAPGPRKPAPALPVEAHRTAEFDSAQAWNATLAACRGQR